MSNELDERRQFSRESIQDPEDVVEIALGYPAGTTLIRPLVNRTRNGFAFKMSKTEGTFLVQTPIKIRRLVSVAGETALDLLGRVCHSSAMGTEFLVVGVEIQSDVPGRGRATGDRFVFEKTIYLTDTNALGNAYFARYFDWQGTAREEFLRWLLPDPMGFFGTGNKFFTVKAETEYKSGLSLYDEVQIEIRTANIRAMSFDFVFLLSHKASGRLVAKGRQRFCVMGKDNRFTRIPAEMRVNLFKYRLGVEDEPESSA